VSDIAIDRVLTAAPPAFSAAEAADLARDLFGVEGIAHALDSERDQAFLIDGARPAVLKISNAAEDPAQLDFEALAAQRIVQLEPDLPVALPWLVPGTNDYRAAIQRGAATHYARMYDRLPGATDVNGADLSDEQIRDWATMAARVGKALRGFWHPKAARVMLWDAQHALRLRPMVSHVPDPELRDLINTALDRYEQVVTPIWPRLRAQVIHTDLVASNVLVDDAGHISGIIDFGDASWTAVVIDLVSVLRTVTAGRAGDELFRAARIAIDGFEKVTPLEPQERAIMGELLAARSCAAVVIPASRAGMYADPDALQPDVRETGEAVLRELVSVGWEEVGRKLGGREPGAGLSVPDLAEWRKRVIGPAMTNTFYREPLHLVRGDGVWLFDEDGRRYLDAYNNVPVVGHNHPRVVEAMVRQARRLNTNMRYLHETAFEVAERLIATTSGELDVVMYVNSGSEANDIAWRIARAVTGGTSGIATDWAYHGITSAIHDLTPEEWGSGEAPEHVRTWLPTDPSDFTSALAALTSAGHKPAAAIMDGVLTSDGILSLDPAVAADLVRQTHEAGALWIADEVQSGFGRTGAGMWGYQRLGITPDIVTLGKPMGNGMPVAAVMTRRDLAERFVKADFFSTFGGNQLAMAAAKAVLEVIDDERIIANAAAVGEYLGSRLRALAAGSSVLGEVRQIGLAIGVDTPSESIAKDIANALRDAGVLIGTTGRDNNVLKIRPPLVFQRIHADQLTEALRQQA
jgi:4-aminobutyrate aminotransferase-like enzyme/Ser/Thr protein kinase RdoA (MazF antagonist)